MSTTEYVYSKRTSEFVLGLIGGIFGVIGAILAMFIGSIGAAFEANGAGSMIGLGISALLASILGIIGSTVVKSKAKTGGIMMLVAGVWGIISISMFYIPSLVLLAIGGLMGLIVKSSKVKNKETVVE